LQEAHKANTKAYAKLKVRSLSPLCHQATNDLPHRRLSTTSRSSVLSSTLATTTSARPSNPIPLPHPPLLVSRSSPLPATTPSPVLPAAPATPAETPTLAPAETGGTLLQVSRSSSDKVRTLPDRRRGLVGRFSLSRTFSEVEEAAVVEGTARGR
jgi:hypothetical protein